MMLISSDFVYSCSLLILIMSVLFQSCPYITGNFVCGCEKFPSALKFKRINSKMYPCHLLEFIYNTPEASFHQPVS